MFYQEKKQGDKVWYVSIKDDYGNLRFKNFVYRSATFCSYHNGRIILEVRGDYAIVDEDCVFETEGDARHEVIVKTESELERAVELIDSFSDDIQLLKNANILLLSVVSKNWILKLVLGGNVVRKVVKVYKDLIDSFVGR